MSWTPLKPPAAAKGANAAPITVGSSAGGRRLRPRITIVIRTGGLDGAALLKLREGVQVLVGGGNHAGQLRIEPGGPFVLAAAPGRGTARATLMLRLDLPRGVEALDRKPEPVEFDHGDGWIEITLPDWARGAPAPAPVAQAAPPAAPAKAPYSLSERVPDPAAPLRGARP